VKAPSDCATTIRLVRSPIAQVTVSAYSGRPADVSSHGRSGGLLGHSLGGWTALATPDVEPRIGAVVALAPAGSSHPRPGIAPVQLPFTWNRDVPTLILTGDADVMTPLDGVSDVFSRIPSTKRMFVLAGADYLHLLDDVTTAHEALRSSQLPGDAAWIPARCARSPSYASRSGRTSLPAA
jgi:dienelactone hydrolase